MRNFRINLADGLGLVVLLASIFAPFFASSINLNTSVVIMLAYCYIFAYLGYIISFTDTGKVFLMGLPLVLYTVFLTLFLRGFQIPDPGHLVTDIMGLLTNSFDLIFVTLVFFLVELVLSKIFGRKLLGVFAALSLGLYLIMVNTSFLPFDIYYKDILVYFAFYTMGSRISPAATFNKWLIPLALLIFIGEVYVVAYYKYYPGIYFSLFILAYVLLKSMGNIESSSMNRFLIFAYLYPYQVLAIVFGTLIKANPLVITSLAVLATYVLSQLIYRFKVKFLSYIYVGIY